MRACAERTFFGPWHSKRTFWPRDWGFVDARGSERITTDESESSNSAALGIGDPGRCTLIRVADMEQYTDGRESSTSTTFGLAASTCSSYFTEFAGVLACDLIGVVPDLWSDAGIGAIPHLSSDPGLVLGEVGVEMERGASDLGISLRTDVSRASNASNPSLSKTVTPPRRGRSAGHRFPP